jgi:hypothetical protein
MVILTIEEAAGPLAAQELAAQEARRILQNLFNFI